MKSCDVLPGSKEGIVYISINKHAENPSLSKPKDRSTIIWQPSADHHRHQAITRLQSLTVTITLNIFSKYSSNQI